MLLPTQDANLIEKSAEALRKKYLGFGKLHVVTSWEDTPYKDYWMELTTVVLKIAEGDGYYKGLPPNVEEALNSGGGVYRP